MICVYKIENIITNDLYVGSTVNFRDRKWRHFSDLSKGKHHSIILQRAYDKYGKENFEISVLEECNRDNLIDTENKYLTKLEPKYNICRIANSTLGYKVTEETKQKLSKYAKENNIKPPESTWMNKRVSVHMLNDDGEIINSFESLSDACRFLGKNGTFASTLSRAVKRNIKAYGYKWKYKNK